jgi:hypothetical protein
VEELRICVYFCTICAEAAELLRTIRRKTIRWYFTLSELSPDEHFTGKDIV